MPKLLLFAPCERVVIDQTDHSVSLISLLTGITASVPFPPDLPMPENTALPMRWYVLAVWKGNSEDVQKTFDQRVVLRSPLGSELLSLDLAFNLANAPIVRSVAHLSSFPLPQFGEYVLTLSLKTTEEESFKTVAEYGFDIVRGPDIDPPKQNLAG